MGATRQGASTSRSVVRLISDIGEGASIDIDTEGAGQIGFAPPSFEGSDMIRKAERLRWRNWRKASTTYYEKCVINAR